MRSDLPLLMESGVTRALWSMEKRSYWEASVMQQEQSLAKAPAKPSMMSVD